MPSHAEHAAPHPECFATTLTLFTWKLNTKPTIIFYGQLYSLCQSLLSKTHAIPFHSSYHISHLCIFFVVFEIVHMHYLKEYCRVLFIYLFFLFFFLFFKSYLFFFNCLGHESWMSLFVLYMFYLVSRLSKKRKIL